VGNPIVGELAKEHPTCLGKLRHFEAPSKFCLAKRVHSELPDTQTYVFLILLGFTSINASAIFSIIEVVFPL